MDYSLTVLFYIRPVYAVSFNPDKTMLLSGSEDGAVRLWSLQTWTCLVSYKAGLPILIHIDPCSSMMLDMDPEVKISLF
jgi:WD40 repeat protein